MSDFEVFDQIMNSKLSIQEPDTDSDSDLDAPIKVKCLHIDTIYEAGSIVCSECGEEIDKVINHKDLKYQIDCRSYSDPNRLQARKDVDKSIDKDLENLGISESVRKIANDLYLSIVKDKIFRSNNRRGIIFACVFYAYKKTNNYQPIEVLLGQFNIKRKSGLWGIKYVNTEASFDSMVHESAEITPKILIGSILSKFNASEQQKNEVYELYDKIQNRSAILNRARPQSLCASLIFYWMSKNKIDISIEEFTKRVDLSQITIKKNMSEIDMILKKRAEKDRING